MPDLAMMWNTMRQLTQRIVQLEQKLGIDTQSDEGGVDPRELPAGEREVARLRQQIVDDVQRTGKPPRWAQSAEKFNAVMQTTLPAPSLPDDPEDA